MSHSDIPGFSAQFIQLDEIKIHFVHNGRLNGEGTLTKDPRATILFLHGFPEYHGGWQKVLPLLAQDYLIIAPDQRGYNRSSAPQEPEAYQTKLLVADMACLMQTLLPDMKYHLVGHDWGASIAYALAMQHAHHVSSLSVVNGVHPLLFQRALVSDEEQIRASQYIHILRSQDAAEKMYADNFAKTFSMFEKFSSSPWLTPAIRNQYITAWQRHEKGKKRMNAMLNWYRATPMVVPKAGEPVPHAPLLDMDPQRFQINMPHQVVWGMQDTALLPISRAGLEEFAPGVKILEVPDGGHWINHTHPVLVASEIQSFISAHETAHL